MDTRIREIIAKSRGPRVLDVGCVGQGVMDAPDSPLWLHGHLMGAFDDVWGIDLLPNRIAALRDAGVLNVFVADAQDYSLGYKFDTIIAGELIEHLPNPGAFLTCSARHLAPRGQIVLTTPYVHGLEFVSYALLRFPTTCPNPEHTFWLCPTTLATLAASSGLRLRSWKLLRDDRVATGWGGYSIALRGQTLLNRFLPERVMGKTLLAVLEPEIGV